MELHCWNHGATLLEPCSYTVGTMELHCWNHGATLLEPWSYTVGTMELHCWNHGATLLEPYNYTSLEAVDVYCFGHVLYEMALGVQLNTPTCDTFPPECPAQIRSVLESILTTEACKNGLPTVANLLSHPLFSDVNLVPQTNKPVLKIPSKLKDFVKSSKEEIESRLKSDQKLLKQVQRLSKAKEFHMSEEETKKRRRSRKSSTALNYLLVVLHLTTSWWYCARLPHGGTALECLMVVLHLTTSWWYCT
uniref:Protein kinase domain-containing protein n=1 Tax=Biomphalaria glabrata TaxID=6526 RepID=A0A2C9LVA4_BIOGL